MAEMTYYDSPLTGPELDEAFRNLGKLGQSVADAAQSAETAAFWAGQAQHSANGALGWYDTPTALRTAYPEAQAGQWALVGSTASLWIWNSASGGFVDTGAHLYKATFLLGGWSGSGPYTQTVSLAPVDGGPPAAADCHLCSAPMCRQTGNETTNRILADTLSRINAGSVSLGSGTVTAAVFRKPDSDIEVFWQIKKGGS